MMPIIAGVQSTKRQIILYTIITISLTLLPVYIGQASLIYGAVASMLGLIFLGLTVQVYRAKDTVIAMRLFAYSIAYLFFIFLSLTLDTLLR